MSAPRPVAVGDDAEKRYRETVATARRLRAEWRRLGYPMLEEGIRGQSIPHPLVKMIAEAERDADRFAKAVKGRHSGPAPSAVVGPSIAESPAAKLRAAK